MPRHQVTRQGLGPTTAVHTVIAVFMFINYGNLTHRRWSRTAVTRVGIGMCGLVTFDSGPCTAVESAPNSRPVSAMANGRRPDSHGSYRKAYRLRPETEQALAFALVGEWITC